MSRDRFWGKILVAAGVIMVALLVLAQPWGRSAASCLNLSSS